MGSQKSPDQLARENLLHDCITEIAVSLMQRDIEQARQTLTIIFSLKPDHADIPTWRQIIEVLQKYDWIQPEHLLGGSAVFIKDDQDRNTTPLDLQELLLADMKGTPKIPIEKIKAAVVAGHVKIIRPNSDTPLNQPIPYH